MKKIALVVVLSVGLAGVANAGCLKGAAIGGVAGHFAGKHTILGAGAGCLVARHMEKKAAKEAAKKKK